MSLSAFLARPNPTIAYCAIHEALRKVPREEYVKTMLEFHARVREESRNLSVGYGNFLEGEMKKEAQVLAGSLSEFLQVPLRIDTAEVQKRLVESFGRLSGALSDGPTIGLVGSTEGEFIPISLNPEMKGTEAQGEKYLEGLGFGSAEERGALFESTFLIEGGKNLDILEHVVRDILGIYATTHGKHIREFGRYAYAVYNRVLEEGDPLPSGDSGEFYEAVFFFSKPTHDIIKYAPFRKVLVETVGTLRREIPITTVSLWQRKLGLGAGVEFVLRLVAPSREIVPDVVRLLTSEKALPVAREALITNGNLLLKRLLHQE